MLAHQTTMPMCVTRPWRCFEPLRCYTWGT